MTQVKGIDFLLNVNTGTTELPVWTKIAGQRGATLNRSAETLETTSKDSDGFKDFESSFIEWSIEAEGLVVLDDVGYTELEDSFMSGTKLQAQISTPSGQMYQGMVIVTDLPLEFAYDDMATYSVSLQGAGALAKITA